MDTEIGAENEPGTESGVFDMGEYLLKLTIFKHILRDFPVLVTINS